MSSKSVPIVVRDLTRRLMSYTIPQMRLAIGGAVCAVINGLIALQLVWLLKTTYDALSLRSGHLLLIACIGIPGLYLFKWGFTYFQNIWFSEMALRIGVKLRNDIYTHLQSLSLSYFNRQRTGDLMSTLANDVPVVQNGITSLQGGITGIVMALGGLIAIFKISWFLSCISLLVVPPIIWAINRIGRTLRAISLETQERLSDMTVQTEETLAGIRIVRSFAAEKREIERFQVITQEAKSIAMSGIRRSSALGPTTDLLGAIGISIALGVGGAEVLRSDLSIASLMVFVMMMDRIRLGAGNLGSIFVSWRQTQGAAQRIFANVLDVPTDVVEAPGAKPLPQIQGRVRFEQVGFAYRAGKPVLEDLTFTMEPGEVIAVVGPSGAGKSTLADLIPRFYDPTTGSVWVDNHNIKSVTLDSLRRQIGIVPQETILFGGTVRDNIAYGLPEASLEQVEAAATSRQCCGFHSRYAKWLRHAGGQSRRAVVRWGTAENCHSQSPAEESENPDSRRGDVLAGLRFRNPRATSVGRADERAHNTGNCPSIVHHCEREPDYRAGERPDGGIGNPRRANDARRNLCTALRESLQVSRISGRRQSACSGDRKSVCLTSCQDRSLGSCLSLGGGRRSVRQTSQRRLENPSSDVSGVSRVASSGFHVAITGLRGEPDRRHSPGVRHGCHISYVAWKDIRADHAFQG